MKLDAPHQFIFHALLFPRLQVHINREYVDVSGKPLVLLNCASISCKLSKKASLKKNMLQLKEFD